MVLRRTFFCSHSALRHVLYKESTILSSGRVEIKNLIRNILMYRHLNTLQTREFHRSRPIMRSKATPDRMHAAPYK